MYNALDGLNNPSALGEGWQQAFTGGMEFARQAKLRNALAEYGMNPGNDTAAGVMQHDPVMGIKLGQMEQEREQARLKAAKDAKAEQRANLLETYRLFNGATPENYQQRISMAQELGLDIGKAPAQFDPAWVERGKQVIELALDRPEALSSLGKQLTDMGLEPGTPEFEVKFTELLPYEYARPYTAEGGVTKLYMPDLRGGQNNLPRPQTQAERDALPPGSQYIAPDNSIRTVGGGGSDVTGGFPR